MRRTLQTAALHNGEALKSMAETAEGLAAVNFFHFLLAAGTSSSGTSSARTNRALYVESQFCGQRGETRGFFKEEKLRKKRKLKMPL